MFTSPPSLPNPLLRRPIGQLRPQHSTRMHPRLLPIIPIPLKIQLVDIHINIPVLPHARAIRPHDPWVPYEPVRLQIGGVVVVNCVLCRHALVYAPLVVAFEAVGVAAALAMMADVAVGGEFGEGVGIPCAKVEGGD